MNQRIETIIVGGGQAGLSTSFCLSQLSREHLVLEQAAQAGHAWRDDRWDSFALLTPNWSIRLPGSAYQGHAPHGFLPKDEIVAYFEQYASRFNMPIHYGIRVTAVEPKSDGRGYWVKTDETVFEAANVVVATGLFQRPKLPSSNRELTPEIVQLHSGQYRNPAKLPPGAVLVVGSAQSGCQIAEELYQSGRTVYLCLGSAGRVPRRYRGKDVYEWLHLSGFLDRTVEQLPSPQARFAGNPHISGRDGGHTLNLHQFARDGVVLLGRLQGAQDGRIGLAPDLKDNLAKADKFEAEAVKLIDGYIQKTGLDAPQEKLPELRDGYQAKEIAELDLRSAGITSIIWAMGYAFDFSMVKAPVFDGYGYPVQRCGVTDYPGLYFVGLPWLSKQKSGLLLGVGEDAAFIASQIAGVPGS